MEPESKALSELLANAQVAWPQIYQREEGAVRRTRKELKQELQDLRNISAQALANLRKMEARASRLAVRAVRAERQLARIRTILKESPWR